MRHEKVAAAMKAETMDLKQLATAAGVSVHTIRRILSPDYKNRNNKSTVEAIAGALKRPVYALFDNSEWSEVGRTAGTGTPLAGLRMVIKTTKTTTSSTVIEFIPSTAVCPGCNLVFSVSGCCDCS